MKRLMLVSVVLVMVLVSFSTQAVSAGNPCDGVQGTPTFTHYYGYAAFVRNGDIVEAFSPRGDRCGCFMVHTDGLWGYMRVYGEDAGAYPPIPGMKSGEPVTLKVNGRRVLPSPVFQGDWNIHQLELRQLNFIYLPFVAGKTPVN